MFSRVFPMTGSITLPTGRVEPLFFVRGLSKGANQNQKNKKRRICEDLT